MNGAPLPGQCSACAAEVGPNQRFCANCGHRLGQTAGGDTGAGTADPARSAERRLVSVLFVDLEGFTAIAELLDPEEVRGLQERYFAAAQSAITRYGGTLEKFIGDAVMAFWGAPRAHEDDGERAVRAGLDVVRAVASLRVGRRRMKARAAVATGEAAVTYSGGGLGMIAGDLVNTAARLQQAAPRGGVLVDETTRRVAGSQLQFEPAGQTRLKGKRRAVTTWLAQPASRGGRPSTPGVHHGPFVGRQSELSALHEAYRATLGAGSRILSVIGIAGIGKSRLAWEFERLLEAEGESPLVLSVQVAPYGEGIAFAPLAEVVRRLADLPRAGRGAPAKRRLARALARVGADDDERRWLGTRIEALLEPQPSPGYERDELFAAWRRFLEHHARTRALVLIIEDVQWADPALLDFLEHVAAWSRSHRLLLITLARPELLDRRPSWAAGRSGALDIRLGPLAPQAMAELLTALVPSLSRPALRRIVEHAGGVPLYGVEVARMLAAGTDASEQIPATLHSLVSARIDTLPAPERRVLLTAAAAGQRFSVDTLADLLDSDRASIAPLLETLVERELLTREGLLDEQRLTFVQQVVHDVAYRTLTRRERHAAHLRAAAHFGRQPGADNAEQIAEHFYHAFHIAPDHPQANEIAGRALPALRQAATRATALHSPERALTHLERALELVTDDAERVALLAEAAGAARAAARFEKAEDYLHQLIDWHTAHDEFKPAVQARARLASMLLATERHAAALTDLEAALREVADLDGDPTGIELAAQLARGRMLVGDDEGGRQWAQRALDGGRRLGVAAAAVDALTTLGTAQVHLGEVDVGLANLRRAVAESNQLGLLGAELRARNNLAWQMVVEDPHATLETARAGLQLAANMGVTDMTLQLSEITAAVAADTGDWDLALSVLDDVRDLDQAPAHHIQFATTEVILRALRGELAAAGELAEGLAHLETAVDRQITAGLERARAWLSFVEGRFADAHQRARDAAAHLLWADEVAAWTLAGRAALWQRNEAAVAEALAALEALGPRGRLTAAARQTLAAGAAAIAGASDAASLYAEAILAWRALRLPPHLGLCLADRGQLMGVRDEEAERIFFDLGAIGLAQLMRSTRAVG
jgi:class 3 adenylate cyclase